MTGMTGNKFDIERRAQVNGNLFRDCGSKARVKDTCMLLRGVINSRSRDTLSVHEMFVWKYLLILTKKKAAFSGSPGKIKNL